MSLPKLLKLLTPLFTARRDAADGQRAAEPRQGAEETTAAVAVDADERPRGCGWFDSSHDLQRGLSVREHATADSLGRELPLASWLELQLAGWCSPLSIAQQT
jgi:hypothetical protein